VHIAVDFGSWLEFAGMTVAIAWLATYGLALIVEGRDEQAAAVRVQEALDGDAHDRIRTEAAWPGRTGLSESA
jgi:hypothetical protein